MGTHRPEYIFDKSKRIYVVNILCACFGIKLKQRISKNFSGTHKAPNSNSQNW